VFSHFAIFDVGTPELVLILAIALLLFGGKKLPELSRSIGESIAELKKGASHAEKIKNEVTAQAIQVKDQITNPDSEA
jgi:sec-independent protein translocase protein TatA